MLKNILSAVALFAVLLTVVSCGGASSTGGDCGSSTTNVTVQYVYVANQSANSISAFEMSTTGELKSVASATASGGQGSRDIAFDATHKLLFVLNRLSANVSVFKVDGQTGSLSAVAGSPFVTGAAQVTSMALHPSGKLLFVTDVVNGLRAFSIDTDTGALVAATGSPFSNGLTQPSFVAMSPNGKFVYVANATAPLTIVGYQVDATNGTIQAMDSPFIFDALTPAAMLIDTTNKYLLVASSEGVLSHFDINATTGELTENVHSPATIPSAAGVEFATTGSFLYVLDTTGHVIDLYVIKSDGSIDAPGSQLLNGVVTPSRIAVDATGKYVVLTDAGGASIASYAIDTATGELTAGVAPVAAGAGASGVSTGTVVRQETNSVPCQGGGGRKV